MKKLLAASIILTTVLASCQGGQMPSNAQQAAPQIDAATSDAGSSLNAQALNSWPVLKMGSTGTDVRTVQYLLNARSYGLAVDSQFGSGTDSAVRRFQSSQGLTADGVVGANTWSKLIITVQEGSTGNAVKAVQAYLGIATDGIFGAGTASAVRSFQSRNGLTADGVVGPATWQALVAGTTTTTTNDRITLARQILANSRITLSHSSSTVNGSPYQTVLDTSRGLMATSGCAGNANCGAKVYLDSRMLSGMLNLATKYSLTITSTTGSGQHSATSYHYKGRALDIGAVNGVAIGYGNGPAVESACRAAGAIEVLGPGDAGHSTHVHCAW